MYSRFLLAQRYVQYWFTAANGRGHGTHSPFVYQFIRDVLNDTKSYPDYSAVEALRQSLKKQKRFIPVTDYGAGSVTGAQKQRRIADIARHAAKSPKYASLLYRMASYYQPSTVLELGTSLGLTTAYLSKAVPSSTVISLEGAPAIAEEARKNLRQLDCQNARVITGPFEHTLTSALQELQQVDFCFIDGNHREEPTLDYFHQLLPYLQNDSLLVFDDIHWSAGMTRAWDSICEHEQVRCSIDLFFIGIVVFRDAFREKQHFRIRW